jgi:hypothetical protein
VIAIRVPDVSNYKWMKIARLSQSSGPKSCHDKGTARIWAAAHTCRACTESHGHKSGVGFISVYRTFAN